MRMARAFIGTSGWHYKHWLGNFYTEKSRPPEMFRQYLKHFDTVELNNPFYRLPEPETFAAWRETAPPGFIYAVKASRFITHNKRLKDPENAVENFLPRAERLQEKLGPILFQLPPKWRLNLDRLEGLLQILPPVHRYTFEFREPSWLNDEVYRLLRRHNAAFCIYELAGYHTPFIETADWIYVRLHGPTQWKYAGSYSREQLGEWARRIERWLGQGRDVYVYFDNDQAGYAAFNARDLKAMVEGRRLKAA